MILAAVTSAVADVPQIGWISVIFRLVLASILGAVIGMERKSHGRTAGLRTMMLVSLGCCLVMLISNSFAAVYWPYRESGGDLLRLDPARMAYGVMTGVGFLGAGTILKSGLSVRGLTTAATIWCVAAIGLAAGMGLYFHCIVTMVLVLIALFSLERIDDALPTPWRKTLDVTLPDEPDMPGCFADKIRLHAAKISDISLARAGDQTIKITYSITLADRSEAMTFFNAIARQPEVRYIQMR